MKVTTEQIQAARRVNLFDWLIAHPVIEYKRDGSASLKLLSNHSVNVYKSGYKDFASDEHGNAIDFLVRYCGYDFKQAVTELAGDTAASSFPAPASSTSRASTAEDVPQSDFLTQRLKLPERNITTKRVYAYLIGRGLPAAVVKTLVNRGLLYEDDHHNAVFLSSKRDFFEVRGTLSQIKYRTSRREEGRYWLYNPNSDAPTTIYICESSIDAVSLAVLHSGRNMSAAYVSIAGVGNYRCIDNVAHDYPGAEIVIACDADDAGQSVAQHYPQYRCIVPKGGKDWNDMLQERTTEQEKKE